MPTPYVNKRTDTSHACPCMHDWEKKRRDEHHRKQLEKMKPTIDTRTPPASQPHLTLYGRDYAAKKKATTEAAFADLKMIQSIAKTMTRPVTIPERQGPVSLNADYRKQQITKIMKENHTLLHGIESVKPCMNTMESVNEHREKMRYVILGSHAARKGGVYDDHIQQFKVQDQKTVEQQKQSTKLRIESLKMRRTEGADPKKLDSSQSLPSLPAGNQTAPAASGSRGGRLGSLASASAASTRAKREPEEQRPAPAEPSAPAEPAAAVAAPAPEAAHQSEQGEAAAEQTATAEAAEASSWVAQLEVGAEDMTAEQMVAREAPEANPAAEANPWVQQLEVDAGVAS